MSCDVLCMCGLQGTWGRAREAGTGTRSVRGRYEALPATGRMGSTGSTEGRRRLHGERVGPSMADWEDGERTVEIAQVSEE